MEKMILIAIIWLLISAGLLTAKSEEDPQNFWTDGYSVQTSAKTPAADARSIQAKVEGEWQEYPLVEFPAAFWDWNRSKRLEYLDIFREMLEKGKDSTRSPQLSGPHNGIVATYGAARKDSRFKLNNAVKGMGFLPGEAKIGELIKLLQEKQDAPLPEKLDILSGLYNAAEENFAHDRLVSLELYSEPGNNTQTFMNQMVSPACVTVWLDIPTYKIKQIARLLHPLDPKLTTYEKQVVQYVNLMHSFFHGQFPRDYIAVVYYSVEVYDSSPGKPEGKGTKISP